MGGHVNRGKNCLHIALICLALLLGLSQSIWAQTPFERNFNTRHNELKVMTYNLLNLYDTYHDEGFQDYTFLPAFHSLKAECQKITIPYYRELCINTDWTPQRLDAKLNQIRDVIRAQGDLPDILAVQEIENHKVIRMLAQKLGYNRYLVSNSISRRGADVALLFRQEKLEFIDWDQIQIQELTESGIQTRPILKANFRVAGSPRNSVLGVYVNHWPSQAAPIETRIAAARTLAWAVDQETKRFGSGYHVVALGDFNTTTGESPNAFDDVLHNRRWRNSLLDTQMLSRQYGQVQKGMSFGGPLMGTYWYRGENVWNYFDRILVSKNLFDRRGMNYDPNSYHIMFEDFMSQVVEWTPNGGGRSIRVKVPFTFNFQARNYRELGYSDHLPVIIKLRIR